MLQCRATCHCSVITILLSKHVSRASGSRTFQKHLLASQQTQTNLKQAAALPGYSLLPHVCRHRLEAEVRGSNEDKEILVREQSYVLSNTRIGELGKFQLHDEAYAFVSRQMCSGLAFSLSGYCLLGEIPPPPRGGVGGWV